MRLVYGPHGEEGLGGANGWATVGRQTVGVPILTISHFTYCFVLCFQLSVGLRKLLFLLTTFTVVGV